MPLTEHQSAILKATAQFLTLAKYHGAMPSKHIIAYRPEDVTALVAQGLLEWAQFTYGCGKELKGLRLTSKGQLVLDGAREIEPAGKTRGELAYEHLLILQDVYHFSRMPRYRRMMPEKKAGRYVASDFEDLLNRGYILKLRLKVQRERTFKGYVTSDKGEQALKQAGML
jgi:hypothetical protein